MPAPINRSERQSKGLIRSLNRRGTVSDKSPPIKHQTARLNDPSVCSNCGAVFHRRTWRVNHNLGRKVLARAPRTICPACKQERQEVGYGKVTAHGRFISEEWESIYRRLHNVAELAAAREPERRIVSMDRNGDTLEVITTSEKLAHRITRELQKMFGGRTSYVWEGRDASLSARIEM